MPKKEGPPWPSDIKSNSASIDTGADKESAGSTAPTPPIAPSKEQPSPVLRAGDFRPEVPKVTVRRPTTPRSTTKTVSASPWGQEHFSLGERIDTPGQTARYEKKENKSVEALKVATSSPIAELTLTEERERAREAIRNSVPATEGQTLREERVSAEMGIKNWSESVVPNDATPKELRNAIEKGVATLETKVLAEKVTEANTAKEAYFTALATHQHKRNLAGIALESVTVEGLLTPKALKELRTKWVRSRAALAGAQAESVLARMKGHSDERISARDAMLVRLREKAAAKGVRPDALPSLQARYERMVTLKSVVVGAEEEELKVRTESLNTRDKKTLERAHDWYKKQPAPARILFTSALMFGGAAAVGSLVAGSIALSPVALLTAGTGAAMRVAAAMQKTPRGKKILGTLAVLPSIGGIFGLGAQYAVQGIHARRGTLQKAEALLAKREGHGTLSNVKNLEKISKDRKAALVSKQTIAKHGMWARMAASLGLGGLAGSALGHHVHSDTSHEQSVDNSPTHSEHAPAQSTAPTHESIATTEHAPTFAESSAHTQATAGPANGAEHSPQTTPLTSPEATIHATVGQGEGFSELVQNFRHNLTAGEPGLETSSPAVAHLMHGNANDIAREVAALRGDDSMVMHQGDQLFADAKGNVWFEAMGKEPHILFENNPSLSAGYEHHVFTDNVSVTHEHVSVDAPHPAATTESVHHVVEHPVAASTEQTSGDTYARPILDHEMAASTHLPSEGTLVHAPQPEHLDSSPTPAEHTSNSVASSVQETMTTNVHGVNFTKPELLLDAKGHYFTHVVNAETGKYDPEASYNLMIEKGKDLPLGTAFYFVDKYPNALGVLEDKVVGYHFVEGNISPQKITGIGSTIPTPLIPDLNDYQPVR